MPKLFVTTTGAFNIMDPVTGYLVQRRRPHVVPAGGFVDRHLALGDLNVHPHKLPDEADDAEFAKWFVDSNGDAELAMASYASKFLPSPEEPPAKPPGEPKTAKAPSKAE